MAGTEEPSSAALDAMNWSIGTDEADDVLSVRAEAEAEAENECHEWPGSSLAIEP